MELYYEYVHKEERNEKYFAGGTNRQVGPQCFRPDGSRLVDGSNSLALGGLMRLFSAGETMHQFPGTVRSEEVQRKELILRVILLPLTALSILAAIRVVLDVFVYGGASVSVPPMFYMGLPVFFGYLLYLARKGKPELAAILLTFSILLPLSFVVVIYGTDLPQGLLTLALLIVMTGVLVSAQFSSYLALAIGLSLSVLAYVQHYTAFKPQVSWRAIDSGFGDTLTAVATLVVITVISWLSNREIEKSLRRARKSEWALQQERDLLEQRVAERTRELQTAEAEKIAQLARFAEFGRVSSSVMHELLNSVTSVSLRFERLKQAGTSDDAALTQNLKNALDANDRMIEYIRRMREQLVQQETDNTFSINQTITEAIDRLTEQAQDQGVTLMFEARDEVAYFGKQMRFRLDITNLIVNAIEAYEGITRPHKAVRVTLAEDDDAVRISVADDGSGIRKADMDKLFTPFFSTKDAEHGMGVGLSITRDSIEHDFGGTIGASSVPGQGTTFTIELPRQRPHSRARKTP